MHFKSIILIVRHYVVIRLTLKKKMRDRPLL